MHIVTKIKRSFGFTLIELLTVIIIIAIISAVAIPSYQNNVIRTQIGTMFHDAEAAKLAVSSDFYRLNSFASTYNAGTTDFTTKNSDCVSSIAVASGVITVQGDSTKFSGKNIWIKWTPSIVNNDLSWACSVSSDAAPFVSNDYCQ
jgi:prepilin-type N-terminal cleavage/methylation domain-containing protein